MTLQTRPFIAAVACAALIGSLVPSVANASSKGRRNTAIGLGAAAAQQLLTGKTTRGVLLGAGAAYAYKRYEDARRDEKRSSRVTSSSSRATRNRYGGASANSTYRSRNATDTTRGRYGSFVFTGPLAKDATNLTNRRITVDHNGVMRPVDVPKSATIVQAGATASVHDLKRGDVVRVTADKLAANQWRATRIEVLNSIDAQPRVGTADATVDTPRTRRVVTTRTETVSRYTGVGIVQSVNDNGHSFNIKAGSNLRTIYSDDANFDGVTGVSEIRVGDRVRINGDLEGKDVFARDITLLY